MHEARLMPVLTARFLEEISFNGGSLPGGLWRGACPPALIPCAVIHWGRWSQLQPQNREGRPSPAMSKQMLPLNKARRQSPCCAGIYSAPGAGSAKTRDPRCMAGPLTICPLHTWGWGQDGRPSPPHLKVLSPQASWMSRAGWEFERNGQARCPFHATRKDMGLLSGAPFDAQAWGPTWRPEWLEAEKDHAGCPRLWSPGRGGTQSVARGQGAAGPVCPGDGEAGRMLGARAGN